MAAMGYGPTDMTVGGAIIGGMSDMLQIAAWTNDLRLTEQEQIGIIKEVLATKLAGDGEKPMKFACFTPAMKNLPKDNPLRAGFADKSANAVPKRRIQARLPEHRGLGHDKT